MLAAACHTCSSACKRSVHILLTSPPAPPLAACCVQVADIPDVDLSKVGTTQFGSFEVEVVDYTTEYFATLKASAGAYACLGGATASCKGQLRLALLPPAASGSAEHALHHTTSRRRPPPPCAGGV